MTQQERWAAAKAADPLKAGKAKHKASTYKIADLTGNRKPNPNATPADVEASAAALVPNPNPKPELSPEP